MKFLIDQNLSPLLAAVLSDDGHDAVHVRDRGLQRASDAEIVRLAAAEGRVVVSADTDFGGLLAESRATAPSVVLIRRTSDRSAGRLAALLRANIPTVSAALEEGAVVVLEEERVRVRPLPLL